MFKVKNRRDGFGFLDNGDIDGGGVPNFVLGCYV